MLEISRSEAMTGRKQFTWFDVGELAAELAEMYDPLADERGASLRYERPDRPVPLFGHRQLLAQALSNLLENAIRYGAGARRRGQRRRSNPERSRIRIESRIAAPAFRSTRREEALRRFGRLDSSRSDEGAGLGLALVKSIAHLHEGELHLDDNRPGPGHHTRYPGLPPAIGALNAPGAAFSTDKPPRNGASEARIQSLNRQFSERRKDMAHGYLEDGYGTHREINPDRGDRRDFRDHDWRDRHEDWRDRDRGIFGADERGWRGEQSQRWPYDRRPEQRGRG